ncbi:hypothetical protein I4U23_010611 [Adineta vaga]|nr:hypothetical protein I4U23_010611 [Adineta vaga]
MRISIKTSKNPEQIYRIDIESSIKIKQMKQHLAQKHNDIKFETMSLLFDGEVLNDENTLTDYNIQTNSVLELIDSNLVFKYVNLDVDNNFNRIELSSTGKSWLKVQPGLCFESQCTNSECDAYQHTVIVSVGYQKFSMSDIDEKTSYCPICQKYVNPDKCAFNNCLWKFDGMKNFENGQRKRYSSDWKQADDAYYRFNDDDCPGIGWITLTFETKKLSKPIATVHPSRSSTVVNATTPPIHDRSVEYFDQPSKFWCPWKSNSCTNQLVVKGQGTVEIMQQKSIPFELWLSNKENPQDPNAYVIILSVEKDQVKLIVNSKEIQISTNPLYTLQPEDGNWHRYWISFYDNNRNIKYGIGEIRPSFAVFNINLSKEEEKYELMKDIFYIYIKLNHDNQMLTNLKDFQKQFRFFIGKQPILYDPPLFVIPADQYDFQVKHKYLPPSKLEGPCRDLYDNVINFKLNTDEFPNLTDVIETSIRNPDGWCHKKLVEKASRFGKPNMRATYLRITAGYREGNAPGHTYVIEIWPPGHFSPIHNHSNAYAIIRVLHGEILVRLYPTLTLNAHQYEPIEQICRQGSVTWLLPNLNQTHQLKHVDLVGTCCITIQCYAYGPEDTKHYEYFDFIANDKQSIGHFDPTSDADYYQFRQIMLEERNKLL